MSAKLYLSVRLSFRSFSTFTLPKYLKLNHYKIKYDSYNSFRSSHRLFSPILPTIQSNQLADDHTLRPFICTKQLRVQAGDGGNGCIAFERRFCDPKGGPSGGDGGNGAHVIFQANSQISDLSAIPAIVQADHGACGYGKNCHGANAEHLYLQVPLGTLVYDLLHDRNGIEVQPHQVHLIPKLIGSLRNNGDICIVARGGAGGKGNAFFTNSTEITSSLKLHSRKNTPLRVAERGGKGEKRHVFLRMSKLADLGLVGVPNAGKSTLLRSLTRAKPKVAPYPFTTIKPHLGVLQLRTNSNANDQIDSDTKSQSYSGLNSSEDIHSITIADLPGLIEGAADQNKGLGIEFLTLISDCNLLAYIIDCGTPWELLKDCKSSNQYYDEIRNQISLLNYEVKTFDSKLDLPNKCLIIGTKLDIIFPELINSNNVADIKLFNWLKHLLYKAACETNVINSNMCDNVILVSALRGDNIIELAQKIHQFVCLNKQK